MIQTAQAMVLNDFVVSLKTLEECLSRGLIGSMQKLKQQV